MKLRINKISSLNVQQSITLILFDRNNINHNGFLSENSTIGFISSKYSKVGFRMEKF